MRTNDLDEAVDAVTQIYCPHRVHVTGPSVAVDVALDVVRPTSQPLVQLSYSAPVRIDAGDFPQLFLMMHCTRGAARTHQGDQRSEWRAGQTMPFSAGIETQLWFDKTFVQRGMRLDVDKLENLCARWLGHPLTQPLRFTLQPFSQELELVWQRTLAYVRGLDDKQTSLASAPKAALDEYLLTLLLHHHPHNYSDELTEPVMTPVPGVVRRAERFIEDHADSSITVSDVAAALGISLRSLQLGFRQWRSTTPLTYLRYVRLQRVREELLQKNPEGSITDIAMRHGFTHLGRFSSYYRSTFGEAPTVTWRRAKGYSIKK